MTTTFKQDRAAEYLASTREENIVKFNAWLSRHEEVRDCEANRNLFYGPQGYMDFTDPLTDADFDFALSNIRNSLVLQRVPTAEEIVIAENAYRKKLGVPALRELSRLERPVPQPDELPQWYLPIGKTEKVELTAEVLRQAGSRGAVLSLADLKFLVNRYGNTVNDRLGVKPVQQPGYTKSVTI